jgi:hypothetical protein
MVQRMSTEIGVLRHAAEFAATDNVLPEAIA